MRLSPQSYSFKSGVMRTQAPKWFRVSLLSALPSLNYSENI